MWNHYAFMYTNKSGKSTGFTCRISQATAAEVAEFFTTKYDTQAKAKELITKPWDQLFFLDRELSMLLYGTNHTFSSTFQFTAYTKMDARTIMERCDGYGIRWLFRYHRNEWQFRDLERPGEFMPMVFMKLMYSGRELERCVRIGACS